MLDMNWIRNSVVSDEGINKKRSILQTSMNYYWPWVYALMHVSKRALGNLAKLTVALEW